jgi:signal transduction histidine kinase
VIDNGIGFDQEYAEHIFELFKRLHSKASYEGTGIGLALCKKIAENHGGDIYAVSKSGVGTTFKVILPYSTK